MSWREMLKKEEPVEKKPQSTFMREPETEKKELHEINTESLRVAYFLMTGKTTRKGKKETLKLIGKRVSELLKK